MRASCASLSQQYAEVLAVAADDVLVAHNLPEHAASLVTALARLHVRNLARRSSLETDSTREKKGGEERINVKKLRMAVLHGTQEMPVARARVSRTGESSGCISPTCVGGIGREILVLATCLMQFAKAGSAVTLPQQDKSNSADVQRGRENITGFI
jgi:hypothetical protein